MYEIEREINLVFEKLRIDCEKGSLKSN